MTDGPMYVDQPVREIPHPSTWATLSTAQLVELKVYLEGKMYDNWSTVPIRTVLQNQIRNLDVLINTPQQ